MQGFSTDLEIIKKETSTCFQNWNNQCQNYDVDETRLHSINLELMKYIKSHDSRNQQGIKTNYHEGSLRIENKEFNKENIEIPEKYKNFQNYLSSSLNPQEKMRRNQNIKKVLEKSYQPKEILVEEIPTKSLLGQSKLFMEKTLLK